MVSLGKRVASGCTRLCAGYRYCTASRSFSTIEKVNQDLIDFGCGVYAKEPIDIAKCNNFNNITPNIASYVGRNLHNQENHPLFIIKKLIQNQFNAIGWSPKHYDVFPPIISSKQAFDDLLIPSDHICRSRSDTFYYNENEILRSQGTAHQAQLFREGVKDYLVTCDVYRRDEIDSTHFPIFHQVDGGRIFHRDEIEPDNKVEWLIDDLKETLSGMCYALFGKETKLRWTEDNFPFTDPSLELEVFYKDRWIEILGSGVIKSEIINKNFQVPGKKPEEYCGWAFGMGLERLAMVLFDIPDIRLFWSQDNRFLSQFTGLEISKFEPYSKYPPVFKDIAFYLPEDFEINDFYEVVRDIGKELIEKVEIIDEFYNKKVSKLSRCYRITYRSMDKSLTNTEIDKLQNSIRETLANELNYEIR